MRMSCACWAHIKFMSVAQQQKVKKNVSLDPEVLENGQAIADVLEEGNFSRMVRKLIEEKHVQLFPNKHAQEVAA